MGNRTYWEIAADVIGWLVMFGAAIVILHLF